MKSTAGDLQELGISPFLADFSWRGASAFRV